MDLPVAPTKPQKRETTITVAASRREEISADKADIWVTIKGSTLVTGNAALKKAKEVNQLVTALLDLGVKEEELSLQGIQVASSNGILARSTSASYTLRVHCSNLDRLADILGAISAQKNVALDHLIWRYPEDQHMQIQWLESCIAEARERAARIAAALGVKLLSVRGFAESWKDPEQATQFAELASPVACGMMAARERAVDLGFNLSHSKHVELKVQLEFAIDGSERSTATQNQQQT